MCDIPAHHRKIRMISGVPARSVTKANGDLELPPDWADEYIRHRSLLRGNASKDIRTPNHIVDERRRS